MDYAAERLAITRAADQLQRAQRTHDNAAPVDVDDTSAGLMWLIEDAENALGRAQRCIANGDIQAAIDILRSTGNDLAGACWE